MRVLVTGGGGYLGTVLVRQLLRRFIHVCVFDRFSWGTQPLAAAAGRFSGLDVIAGDVRNADAVARACVGMDAVVHLAGIVGYPACDAAPADADSTNVQGTINVLKAAQGRPVLFASTGSTYGKVDGVATEETPVSPLTRYGRNKAEAERHVIEYGGTALRLATLYGLSPRMRWDLLPNYFCRAGVAGEIKVYDPDVRRTFLDVEDAAGAFVGFLKTYDPGAYNVGCETLNLTKLQVAQAVQGLTGCNITAGEGHDPDERDYVVSFEKVEQRRRERLVWVPFSKLSLGAVIEFARVWR